MRTTLTVDDDNVARLERLRRKKKASFKDVVNDALRQGLNALEATPRKSRPFKTRVVDLGPPLFADPKEFLADMDEKHDRYKLSRK